jgi:hypothetical protein
MVPLFPGCLAPVRMGRLATADPNAFDIRLALKAANMKPGRHHKTTQEIKTFVFGVFFLNNSFYHTFNPLP